MSLIVDLESNIPLQKILPFANVDGYGNRTSIFVQGCNIRCIYCHNPETQQLKDCVSSRSVKSIIKEIEPYIPYIRGVTVSGGEPTLYYKELCVLFDELHKKELSCYVDTNGYFDRGRIITLIEKTDKFLFDIKTTGKTKELIGFEKTGNIENLIYLLERNKVEEVRHVVVNPFSQSEKVVTDIAKIISQYPTVLLKLIKVHLRGVRSSCLLDKNVPSSQFMQKLGKKACELGVRLVEIQL